MKQHLVWMMAVTMTASAQTKTTHSTERDGHVSRMSWDSSRRTTVYVQDGKTRLITGGWRDTSGAQAYAETHGGTYVVFVEDGKLHRLESAELDKKMAPLTYEDDALAQEQRQLAEVQRSLAGVQRPLSEQQRQLAAMQRTATTGQEQGTVGAAQGAVGREQGAVGSQQGEIGRQQGEIGRRQGEVGKQMDALLEAAIQECLAKKSCPVVADAGADLNRPSR